MENRDPKRVHREEFWSHVNREEILLHDSYAWQKISQLEENADKEKQNAGPKKAIESLRKREGKVVCKLVNGVLKSGRARLAKKDIKKERMELMKATFDEAMRTLAVVPTQQQN